MRVYEAIWGYRGDGDGSAAAGELMPSELYHAGKYENLPLSLTSLSHAALSLTAHTAVSSSQLSSAASWNLKTPKAAAQTTAGLKDQACNTCESKLNLPAPVSKYETWL